MQAVAREAVMPTHVPFGANTREAVKPVLENDEFESLGDFDYPVEDLTIDPDFKSKRLYTHEEIWDDFCQKLGQHYGLADIRDAR